MPVEVTHAPTAMNTILNRRNKLGGPIATECLKTVPNTKSPNTEWYTN